MRDTIDMAREAGMVFLAHVEEMRSPFSDGVWLEDMKAFEALVRADEQKKWQEQTVVEIHEAVLDEREACLNCYSPDDTATDWADKIRARGLNDQ